jgi:hypothetical protein
MGNMKATFCGHDHGNDSWGDYFGIGLYYGRKTGHGGYGPLLGKQRGARILEFSLQNDTVKLDSWIRQEDGSIETQKTHKPAHWILPTAIQT